MISLSVLRALGLAFVCAVAGVLVWMYRRHRMRRGDLLLGGAVMAALAAVSLRPALMSGLTALLGTRTRMMALAILGNLVLFALFLYALKQVTEVRESLGDLVRALARAEYRRNDRQHVPGGIVVIIPAYNEEKSLQTRLPQIPTEIAGRPVRAMVVLDGARDRSHDVARECAVPVSAHSINRGQGDALRTGFELAVHDAAEVVVTMDGDGQHRPDEIVRLVSPVLEGRADFVIGSRFLGEYVERGGPRHAGIVGFSTVLSWMMRVRITDCTNGFRAIRGDALATLQLRESRFSAPELIMEAARQGLRVLEVPVTVLPRQEGQSKKPASWRYPLGFSAVILRKWLRS